MTSYAHGVLLLAILLCVAGAGQGCVEQRKQTEVAIREDTPHSSTEALGALGMNRFPNPTVADVPALIKKSKSSDENTRKDAIFALGTVANSECIAPVLDALADDDDYVRSYAMMGIGEALEAGRAAPAFLEAVFPALIKLLDRDDSTVSGKAPQLLLTIDKDRALPALLDRRCFTIQNSELHYILRALNVIGHQIPHEQLLPLLSDLRPLSTKYPHSYQYAAALIAYAHHPNADAEAHFRAELGSVDTDVSEGAAEALAIYHGVTNPHRIAAESEEKVGFENLAIPQQHYLAVAVYDAEVNNGGHSQYFWNSSGNSWRPALDGLKAIKAETRAVILQAAVELFGPNGPSIDRAKRQEQLSAINDSKLDDLDNRYYACKTENVQVLLSLYAIEHKQHFTTSQSSGK